MARLVKDGTNLGIKPFLVPINDGKAMPLPDRGGSAPVRHSITTFNHVFISRSSLLQRDTPKRGNVTKRLDYLMAIWCVAIGTLALSATTIPFLARTACTVAMYSKRRHVGRAPSNSVPIIHFVSQYAPILTAFAQSFVLAEFYNFAMQKFTDNSVDFRVRHGIAACFKAIALRYVRDANMLVERCGAQGLFKYNGMSELHGITIAEGDVLALSIRKARRPRARSFHNANIHITKSREKLKGG
ncbi:hypothetical protein B0H17DRAFT_1128555 [Mycena rosella]|uniref:Uncharacterized protein n=1 Tax=Mycena rosella TaxID=1033263 RepID=A0AAD7GQ63_MYCRO|nr:hypothetical protein B0H17DRAFT_1128555 [Mycena rosella]